MDRLFRIGIVGCGGMGSGHAIAIKSGTGNAVWNGIIKDNNGYDSPMTTRIGEIMEVAGIADIREERREWARQNEIYVYENYEAMLQDDTVDAVLIATPNHLHKSMAVEALQAGKHVLCEKPVMITSEDLIEVLQVANEKNLVFYPRQNREWDEDYLIVKKIYDEKLLGDVFDIHCRIMGSFGIPGDWRGKKEYGGGMMLDWGVHLIDRIVKMIPEKIVRVFCDAKYINNAECDDNIMVHLTFESGVTVQLEVNTCHFITLPMWSVYAKDGSAEIQGWSCEGKMIKKITTYDSDVVPVLAGSGLTKTMAPRTKSSIQELPLPRFDFDRNELYKNFVECCQGKAEQIVSTGHALRVLRLMEACFESAKKGETVHFE